MPNAATASCGSQTDRRNCLDLNRVQTVDDRIEIRNIIVSVFDKRKLEMLVPALLGLSPDVRIYSTGNTFRLLSTVIAESDRSRLLQISDYTGQPEMQGGLVKTLDYRIYLGLLSETYNEHHAQDLERTGSISFDMTVCNLYPFTQVVAGSGGKAARLEDARANIDIGGPCMLRASAKNFLRVLPVCDPDDYEPLVAELTRSSGSVSLATRYAFARKAFRHTADYDVAIAGYLAARELAAGDYQYGAH